MNQLLDMGGGGWSGQDKPHAINVNVVVDLQQNTLNLQLSIDPDIPFNEFIAGIKEQILAQKMKAQYEENIEYQLKNGPYLSENESRCLYQLGFINNCTLYVRLKLKQNFISLKIKKRKYQVFVDLQFKKMELQIEQGIYSPVSCIFHDILMELLNNQQLKIDRPLAFFRNEKEIDPFNIQPITDFETNQGIMVNKILPNKQAKQNSIEKYEFALNQIKQMKPFTRKTIKIEYNNNMKMLVENDTTLKEIFETICEDLKKLNMIPYKSIIYDINLKELKLLELSNIYAINNFKVDIQYQKENQIIVFRVNGDFYKKILVKGKINEQDYQILEFMSINTSMDEFLIYLKFKIFGPNQINYKEDFFLYNQNKEVQIDYQYIQNIC